MENNKCLHYQPKDLYPALHSIETNDTHICQKKLDQDSPSDNPFKLKNPTKITSPTTEITNDTSVECKFKDNHEKCPEYVKCDIDLSKYF